LDAFEHVIPVDDDGDPFEDPSPVPDVDDENQLDTLELHRELIRSHNRPPPEFQVHAADQEEEIEEPATEIHIEDGEELKMD
jgi:ubiquitin carboxyl-terminal hydrolase 4/11/15